MDLTAIDWIMLRREDVRRVLDARGLANARVVGWTGAGEELPGPAEIEVDLAQVTDLTSGDLARLGRELTTLVGVEIVVWAAVPGDGIVRSGEKIGYL